MILIFKGPGTTRVITGIKEVMGFNFLRGEFTDRPFGWFRSGSQFGFGCMPEFFQKRFTHIAMIGGGKFEPGKLIWIKHPDKQTGF